MTPAPTSSRASGSKKRKNEQASSEAASVSSKHGTRTRVKERHTTRDQVKIDPVSDDDTMSAPRPASGLVVDDESPPSSE